VKKEENETNRRNQEENETNDQKYCIQLGSRSWEEKVKKLGIKPVLVPGFSPKIPPQERQGWREREI
jgi:hypothetical protein